MNRKVVLIGVACAVVVLAGAVPLGRWLGEGMASDVHERLIQLWPDVMTMPQQDRSLLVLLAFECRLAERPVSRPEILACLRSATEEDRIKRVSASPAEHLEKLIDRSESR